MIDLDQIKVEEFLKGFAEETRKAGLEYKEPIRMTGDMLQGVDFDPSLDIGFSISEMTEEKFKSLPEGLKKYVSLISDINFYLIAARAIALSAYALGYHEEED